MSEYARSAVSFRSLLFATAVAVAGVAGGGELTVGSAAPSFTLVDAVDARMVTMTADDGMVKAVVFTSARCADALAFEPRLMEIGNRYTHRGVRLYAVVPGEPADDVKARASTVELPFPYLHDEGGAVARQYGVTIVPAVYVVDGSGTVRYRGRIDDAPAPQKRTSTELTNALNALLDGRDVAVAESPPSGCAVERLRPPSR